MRSVYSLTDGDVLTPSKQLHAKVAAAARAVLDRRYARSPARWLTRTLYLPPNVQKFTQNGRPAARITVTVREDLAYIHRSDVLTVAQAMQRTDMADKNQTVMPGTLKFKILPNQPGISHAVDIQVVAQTSPSIDVENLRALLTGMSLADARRLLDGSAKNGGWTYTLSVKPDWASRLPIAGKLITINVRRSG